MSMNNAPVDVEQENELRPEDKEAAMEMIREDEFLSKDACAKEVVETGILPNGNPLKDYGEFLIIRRAYIMQELAREKMSKVDPEMVRVVTGVRADLEKYIEGGK